jgi:hypothetical protein
MEDIYDKFNLLCTTEKTTMVQYYYNLYNIDISHNNYEAFYTVCKYNNLNLAKWIYSLDHNIIYSLETEGLFHKIFHIVCYKNYIEIAKWLYNIVSNSESLIQMHASTFKACCINGNFELAKWLYSKFEVDFYLFDEITFKRCCEKKRLDIIIWLLEKYKYCDTYVDCYLDEKLYEMAFLLNYRPVDKMKLAYDKWLNKIKTIIYEIGENNNILIFTIDDIIDLILDYI